MQRGLGQRGAVLPLVAICLAVLMGFAGMAVDVGFLEYKYQAQQSATDAAALGGAESAYEAGCQSPATAKTAALADATLNGFTSGSNNITVTPNAPPTSGPYATNGCAVQVTINNSAVSTFFARVLGFNSMPESTTAVGLASQNNPGCVWLLSTTNGQSNMSNVNFSTPGCDIYINTSANMSNSTIKANYIGYASGTNNTSGTTFTNATPAPMSVVSDPCPQMPGCEYLTKTPPTSSSCNSGSFSTPYSGSGGNVGTAGQTTCYSSFSASGQTLQLCGLIAVSESSGNSQLHFDNAHVSTCTSGASIYMGASVSDYNFSNCTCTITAPAGVSGSGGVALWRDPTQANEVNFSNCTCTITGLMYFPTAQVDYSSATGAYTVMVFGQANFSTSNMSLASPPPNGTVGLKTVLAE